MAVIRFFSLVLIVTSLMLLGADVVSTLETGGETVVRSLDHILMLFGLNGYNAFPPDAPPQLTAAWKLFLSFPGWGVIGVPAAILGLLTSGPRERRAPPPSAPPPPIAR